jgi:hypothetical protein
MRKKNLKIVYCGCTGLCWAIKEFGVKGQSLLHISVFIVTTVRSLYALYMSVRIRKEDCSFKLIDVS